MSEEQHLQDSDDDTSDEEYVPGGEDCAQLSEVESDGEPEDDVNSDNETNNKQKKRKGKTKRKNNKKQKIEEPVEEADEAKQLTEEDQKKKTDSLWADFLKDTDFKPKPKTETTSIADKKQTEPIKRLEENKPIETKKEEAKKPIFFEFAGEKLDSDGNVIEKKEIKPQAPTISRKSGGLGSVLSQIGKKQKISTLEKSKLDWNKFKKEEDIEDELKSHNRGKNGYLERQDFLQRTDLRQFELEKEARAIKRTHRS